MRVSKVQIDGQTFYIEPEVNLRKLKKRILKAVRSGAGFVSFPVVGYGSIDVLVTQTIPVRFETVERSSGQVAAMETDPPPIQGINDF